MKNVDVLNTVENEKVKGISSHTVFQFLQNRGNWINLCILILFFAWNLFLLINHELWRDEVNVYLMGRDLSLFGLFKEINLQGHPVLWYLMVMPFAKLGVSAEIMGILSLVGMSVAACLIVFKAPVSIITKIFILFSTSLTYYYTVIARGYWLVALLIVVSALLYPYKSKIAESYLCRKNRLWVYAIILALLVQADTIGLPFAFLICVVLLLDSFWNYVGNDFELHKFVQENIPLVLPLISAIVFMLEMSGAKDNSTAFTISSYSIRELVKKCIDEAKYIFMRLLPGNQYIALLIIAGLLISTFVLGIMCKRIAPVAVFWGYFAFEVLFSVLVYELNIWHFLMLPIVFLWMLWQYPKNARGKSFAELMLCIISLLCIVRWCMPEEPSGIVNAINGHYSDAPYIADFIDENIPEEAVVVVDDVAFASTILGYTQREEFLYAGSCEPVSYADWSREQTGTSYFMEMLVKLQADEQLRDSIYKAGGFYFIDTWGNSIVDFNECSVMGEMIYQTSVPSAMKEDYTIYFFRN